MTSGRSSRIWVVVGVAAAVGALCGVRVAAGAEVTLRASARVQPGAAVLLSDIATLEGDDAAALGDAVVLENASAPPGGRPFVEITLNDVRNALTTRGVNWGRVALRGTACAVRVGDVAPAPVVVGPSPPPRAYERANPAPIDTSGPPTVRTRIAAALAQLYGVAPSDLRVAFDPGNEDLLAQSELGRRVEVQPEASASSGRMPVRVRIYEGERIALERSVRVEVEVRRTALVLKAGVRRGDTITQDMVRADTMWMSPGDPFAAGPDSVIGMKARTRLAPGTTLAGESLESPVVVKRGELVTVRCLSGGLVVTAKARALGDARAGETVELRLDGSEKTFRACVNGRGRAVTDLDAGGSTAPAAGAPRAGAKEATR